MPLWHSPMECPMTVSPPQKISPEVRKTLLSPCISAPIPFELARDFSVIFTRFEYALKNSNFGHRRHGRYEVNWRRLFETIDNTAPEPSTQQAILFLTENPPNIQKSRHGWRNEQLGGISRFSQAIDAARRVRNNLFHGGKHLKHSSLDRNEMLINSSTTIVCSCIEAIPGIKAAYYSP